MSNKYKRQYCRECFDRMPGCDCDWEHEPSCLFASAICSPEECVNACCYGRAKQGKIGKNEPGGKRPAAAAGDTAVLLSDLRSIIREEVRRGINEALELAESETQAVAAASGEAPF